MTLIICGDCQKEYSDYALSCPVCSRPTDTQILNKVDKANPEKKTEAKKNSWVKVVSQMSVFKGPGRITRHSVLGLLLRLIGLTICEKNQNRFLLLKFQSDSMKRSDQEDLSTEALLLGFPGLVNIVKVGINDFSTSEEIKNKSINEAIEGWEIAKTAIRSSLFSAIIIEGFGEILSLDILDREEITDVISQKQSNIELIFTGENFPSYFSELAYSYSEFVDNRKKNKADSNKKILNGVEVITGDSKGKSTSALGKALQAIGEGISQDKSHRVLILQWLKGGNGYTEDAAIKALRESYPHLVDHLRSGRDAIVWRGQQQPIDYVEAERAWEIAKAAILSGLYKTIILDELNPTVDLGLLDVEPIHQTLLKKPADTEVVITGRCAKFPNYIEIACNHYHILGHINNKYYSDFSNNFRSENIDSKSPKHDNSYKEVNVKLTENILLIDNDYEMREFVAMYLESLGFNILRAKDFIRGMDLATESLPDLIILALKPTEHNNGLNLFEKLRTDVRTSKIPILMISPLGNFKYKGGDNNLSNVDYIYMPFDEEELLVRIKALLRSNN